MHEAGPGSVTQVRACAGELVRLAKTRGVAVHPGRPRDQGRPDRRPAGGRAHGRRGALASRASAAIRSASCAAAKNRFGATDEIGVFEMGDAGLREVKNPSALFLNEGGERAAGAAVFAGIEGSRPVLVEFQALVAPSAYGTPRRAVVGWDQRAPGHGAGGAGGALRGWIRRPRRLLERRRRACGSPSRRRTWPRPRRLVSSALDAALPQDCVVFGEISLSGDVRPVSRTRDAPEGSGQAGLLAARSAPAARRRTAAAVRRDARRRGWPTRCAGSARRGRGDRGVTLFDLIAGLVLVVSVLVGFVARRLREVATVVACRRGGGRRHVRPALHRPDRARMRSTRPGSPTAAAILIVFLAV